MSADSPSALFLRSAFTPREGWTGELAAPLLVAGITNARLKRLIFTLSYEEYLAATQFELAALDVPKVTPAEFDLTGVRALLLGSPDYPAALSHLSSAPSVLFVRGELSALRLGIAIVGTREATSLAGATVPPCVTAAQILDVPVISGLARGVDTLAHQGALSKHVPTVAVLSTYPTHPSPAQNRDLAEEILASGGAVISESFGSAPTPALLQARNRIIAGLASVTIPAEAGLNSGTMGTVAAALEAGRAVVVPLPKPSARMLPGAEALLALAGITEMPRKSLKVTNATFERLKISGFANAVADTPAALTELIVLAHRFSPYLDPATLI